MTAYVISDVVGRDPELITRYRESAREFIAEYGGDHLSHAGAPVESVEGDWTPKNIVVVGLPSMSRARESYRSPEYARALDVREDAHSRNLIFVAGADEDEESSPVEEFHEPGPR